MADPQTNPSSAGAHGGAKRRLLNDHQSLERLLTELTSSLDGADHAGLCESWTRFEQNLRDHLDTEERYLFPLVASAHRDEVEALRSEHQRIRAALSELGVAVDLHTLRKQSGEELIGYIHRHALREEESLYRWIDDNAIADRGLLAMFERRAGHVAPAREG